MTVERGIRDAVYISYHREDSDFAVRLARDLKAAGVDIVPGEGFKLVEEFKEAKANCSRMVVILSPASVNSIYIMAYVASFLEEKKIVIAVICKDCTVPNGLRAASRIVDFRDDQERGFRRLMEMLAPGRLENRERQQVAERAQPEPKNLKKAETASLHSAVPSTPGGNVLPSGVDIFLSHQSSDAEKARMLADAFQREGWSVWWDHRIPPGETWADVIESSIKRSRCVVVLWSKTSVNSKWVKKEARFAEKRACLIPILIDAIEPPFEFEDVQAADLTDWEGERTEAFLNLVAEIRSRLLVS